MLLFRDCWFLCWPGRGAGCAGMAAGGGGGVRGGDGGAAGVGRLRGGVEGWCGVAPVVLVVEDLQWGDGASLLGWRRLGGAVGQVPLLLAGAVRPATGREELGQLRRGL